MVVIAGPDGTGKSMLADALEGQLATVGPVRRFHHRLAILPRSAAGRRATTTPHARAPYPVLLSGLKVLMLLVDHLLGWLIVVRPLVRRGGWVILERGWWDIVVDERRYRLRGVRRFAEWLGRLLPAPRATIILHAPPPVVRARKAELTVAEIDRQLAAWRRLASRIPHAIVLDASRSPEAVMADAVRACDLVVEPNAIAPSGARRWVALPSGRHPRWLIPSESPALVRAGLRVHQPMTRSGRMGWEMARLFAATGLMGALHPVRDSTLSRLVWDFVPEGGTFAAAYGRETGRAVVLILDASGNAVGVAKIARDASGRERLAREAERLRVLGPLLEPPISAPSLLAVEEQVIVLEPIAWHTQAQPWRLPVSLAAAIGRFHRRGIAPDGRTGHPGHGDFAPWNVLRTATGWVLLDWEEASTDTRPFADPFHFLVSAHTLLGRPRREELLRGLDGRGWIGKVLAAYAAAASVDADIRQEFIEYLRTSITTLRPLHPHSARGRQSRRRLLRALAAPE